MSDDDPTGPRKRPDPRWGDTQRASTASERRARERSYGMPAEPEPESGIDTDTFALVERDLSQAGVRIVERSRRSSSDPGSYKSILNLAEEVVAQRRDIAVIKTDVHDIQRDNGNAKWFLRILCGGMIGAIIWMGERVWSRAESEGRDRLRLENVERNVEENRQDLRAIRREKDK